MTRITDLDLVAPDDVEVHLSGTVYLLPGDVPVPDYVAIMKAADAFENADGAESLEAATTLYESVLELFQVRQPELTKVPLGIRQIIRLVFALYGADEGDGDPEPDPTRASEPAESGTTPVSPTPKPRKKRTTAASAS